MLFLVSLPLLEDCFYCEAWKRGYASGNNLLLDSVAAALIGFAVLGAAKPNALGTAIGALCWSVTSWFDYDECTILYSRFCKRRVLVIALVFTFVLISRSRKGGH